MDITGAELIIRFLENRSRGRRDADVVGFIPGGAAMRPLEHALADSALRMTRELGAGILFFDFAPGLAKAEAALAGAKAQRRPMVCIAVQVRRSLIGTDACLPANTRRVLDPLTKRWFHVGAAMELLELLPEVFRLAESGRRGPVLLEIPEDVLTEVMLGAWIPRARTPKSAARAAHESALLC